MSMVLVAKPADVGVKLTTMVQSDPAFRTPVEHVPPVPGKVPSLKMNGAEIPDPVMDVAWEPPALVTVKI